MNNKKDIIFSYTLLTTKEKKLLNKDDFPLKDEDNEVLSFCGAYLPLNNSENIQYSFGYKIKIKTYKDFIKYKKKSKKEMEEFIIKKYNEIY